MLRLAILFAVILSAPLSAQELTSPNNMSGPVTRQVDQIPIEQADGFKRSLIRAIRSEVKAGNMSRANAIKLRVALVSPAFLARAEQLAQVQIVFSGVEAEQVKYDDDGRIIAGSIDWEGLSEFLTKLIPLILQLLEMF